MERNALTPVEVAALPRDFPYGLRFSTDDPGLEASIARHGVLYPIVLHAASGHVIAGHKRLAAARKANVRQVSAMLVEEDLAPQELYLLAVLSNWNQNLSDLDRGCAVLRALRDFGFTEDAVRAEVLPALGIESGDPVLAEAKALAGLDPAILEAVSAGKIPFRGVSSFLRFSPADQKAFVKLTGESLRWTSGQMTQALEWLADLLKSGKKGLEVYWQEPALQKALAGPKNDLRAAGENLFQAIKELRFPRLADCRGKFDPAAREIERAYPGLKLEPPPYFEDEGLVLRAKVRDARAFDELMEVLKKKRSSVHSLFEIML
ncbi:MAG TPA: ParB N-terminal domain-containing protein [Verrucomicrobiae bacterium]|jgi:ParB-like chromosome segregation protein Spo0J|nr:ParB N-terminal domain-containing protein [Verrucomicrobiae bacterium]